MQAPPRLRELRERQMISQNELAERIGVAPMTIQRLERGESSVWPRTIRKIAEGLGVGYDDLYREPEDAPKKAPAPSPDKATGEQRYLVERRLLSTVDQFATRVEEETRYMWQLIAEGKATADRVEYATNGVRITATVFKRTISAALDEGWTAPELKFLFYVYEDVTGAYQEAWRALVEAAEASARSAADTQTVRHLRLVGDESMQQIERDGAPLKAA